MVGSGAQKEEECKDEDVMLLIRIGNKTLLVWRCAPQDQENIDKDETLLVKIGYKMLLVWRCAPQEEEHIEKMRCCWLGEVLKKKSNVEMKMRCCWSGLDIRCCWSGDVDHRKRSI